MANVITKEYSNTALRIKNDAGYIFLDSDISSNALNIIVTEYNSSSDTFFSLTRDDLATLHETLGGWLSDYDEKHKPLPLSKQVEALEPGTVFVYSCDGVYEGAKWFRTAAGATSRAGVTYTGAELEAFFDSGSTATITVRGGE